MSWGTVHCCNSTPLADHLDTLSQSCPRRALPFTVCITFTKENTFSLTCQSPWSWFHSCQLKTQMLFCRCSCPTLSPPVMKFIRTKYNPFIWYIILCTYSTSASCDEVVKAGGISNSRDGVTMTLDHISPHSQWQHNLYSSHLICGQNYLLADVIEVGSYIGTRGLCTHYFNSWLQTHWTLSW